MVVNECILTRVKVRLNTDVGLSDELLNELITTAVDRIALRIGADEIPPQFVSIAVDVCIKMYRRMYYEGIKDEGADTIRTSFIDDILSEYTMELNTYKDKISVQENKDVVRFL